ncbi:gustatory receptor for sugar taste 43a isoform X2 [Episyrphus balteatus]|uniref:gustatory receptor for sugar taste 43a isoform X2 n=1 Tax=Episyrphus balteatus TaxID=286459 RepID=UPI0024861A9F|nr:gustatory receptor for sugar taste 43a isoform X2 [Episyrphus balteatus]
METVFIHLERMEINETTVGVFYISKILALAPFSFCKNAKGKIEIRRSILFAFYSVSLISIMIFLTYRGLLFDANSKIPVRMKSATSKVVTALDVSVVVMSTTSGVICGLVGLKSTQELNKRLQQVDENLKSFVTPRKEQVRAYVMVLVSLLFITVLLGLDVWTWFRVAKDMKIDEENTEMNVQWYIPFYSLYYILTGLHISIAHTTFGVGRRYRRLNITLKKMFLSDEKLIHTVPKLYKKVTAMKILNNELNDSGVIKKPNTETYSASSNNVIERLAGIHESLGICVQKISSAYGFAVLTMLVSCLLHLVATAYFLFLEFLNNKNSVYSWLQVLWIIFHACRLLMIVEPCHLTTVESRQTITILCQINRSPHETTLTDSIRLFWQQLLADKATFSACGLCKVDRQILTSISAAIATYLVILIQFQKSNG